MADGCEWHGHCKDISAETRAHIYGVANILFSATQLLCYTVLSSALHNILDHQKKADPNVCDMSMKTFDDPDDCELKASKVASALLTASCFEVILSFLALRGAYKQANVCFCYTWFVFTSLLVIVVPLLQSIFFIVTTWWNPASYTIITLTGIYSLVKLYGMYTIMNFAKWIQNGGYGHPETDHDTDPSNTKMSTANETLAQQHNNSDVDKDNIAIVRKNDQTLPDSQRERLANTDS